MEELADLHRFNAWANASLVAGLRQVPEAMLTEQREGMYGTLLGVLNHVAQVQSGYLRLLRSEVPERLSEDLTLDEVERILEESAAGLVELARTGSPETRVRIPWFEREFTVQQ